jgi:hypothetical protein
MILRLFFLKSIHPSFAVYAAPLKEYGYDDLSFLREADEAGLSEALTAVGMKKLPHRTRVLRRFRQLATSPDDQCC